jgi:quinoprotein glucose dehydrogenase
MTKLNVQLVTVVLWIGLASTLIPASADPITSLTPNEIKEVIAKLRPDRGINIQLVASEPHIQNPVSFCFDEQGRMYVAETFRHTSCVTDVRGHMDWLEDDLACETVADRVTMLKDKLGDKVSVFAEHEDRVRQLVDQDGDGVWDRSTVFAGDFRTIESGIGAGVLARKGNVYFTNIPDLWLLHDENNDGVAETRNALQTGYGVHIAFLGHDLHGLIMGPDGKLYFSIGDRGLHVETEEGTLAYPHTGAVLRCNLDGSGLEVFAYGLRNPQELAFDKFGNLWTGDNNSDGGDKARWVHLVEGGDSGWRIGYQTAPNRGPWNEEGLWHLGDTAASQVPPLAHIGHGPSGLAYNPGTGMSSRYEDHFFLCNFPGDVKCFELKPNGATFEVVGLHDFVRDMWPVDVSFGPDGGVYIADWVWGWNKTDKGRVYRLYEPGVVDAPIIQATKTLINEGFDHRPTDELVQLLSHQDMRIRQEAQFALADKGREVIPLLLEVAKSSKHQLARLHAIWGLGQLSNEDPAMLAPVANLLSDTDVEVRAQAVKLLGDSRYRQASERVAQLLDDESPRVRMYAAFAAGKLGRRTAIEPVIDMLRRNDNADPYLRHAGVMALVNIHDIDGIVGAGRDESDAVRLASLVALRRLKRPEIAMFLDDANANIVFEAARAINDVPIESARHRLAALLHDSNCPEKALPRVLNANYRLGAEAHVQTLAAHALQSSAPTKSRAEAIRLLSEWKSPSGRDQVTWFWQPLAPRDDSAARRAVEDVVAAILKDAPADVQIQAIRSTGQLELTNHVELLHGLAMNRETSAKIRVEAIKALHTLKDPNFMQLVQTALEDTHQPVFEEGIRQLANVKIPDTVPRLEKMILSTSASIRVKQIAVETLSGLKDDQVEPALVRCMDAMLAGRIPPGVHLELLEAVDHRNIPELRAKAKQHEAKKSKDDDLAAYREALAGGNINAGSDIFFKKQNAQCLKCHKVNGQGGIVGPDLSGIGAARTPEKLLESMVLPNKEIASEFKRIGVFTANETYYGRVVTESPSEITLLDDEGKQIKIPKDQIEEQKTALSAMPQNLIDSLSLRDLRNLVAYMTTLNAESKPQAK